MATSTKIDDLLQCPVCLEIFYDPKVLDCQHTFCANCLKVYFTSSSGYFSTPNSIECPMCRRTSNLINHSIDSLPGNYIVRDIIERQYGVREPNRPPGYSQQIRDRVRRLQSGEDEKQKENETNYWDYLKPAAAALIGVLGGLVLAKSVKTLSEDEKKKDDRR